MSMLKIALAFFLGMVLFGTYASAAPVLFDPVPKSSGFVGSGAVNFSVNVTSPDLNASGVTLFVISKDAKDHGDSWDNFIMACTSYAANSWLCKKSVSFAIAGSDTPELFYFVARENSGTNGTLGSASDPLTTTIDRNVPSLSFLSPTSNAHVSGNVTIGVSVSDSTSGLNLSSVQYSTGNNTWYSMTNNLATLDSTVFSNGAQVTITARAKDNVGNTINASVNVIADNEVPGISIVGVQSNALITGVRTFNASVTDTVSGVSAGKVKLNFANTDFKMSCAGSSQYNCSVVVDTSAYGDNTYNATFSVTDNAGNFNSTSILITLKNAQASAKILMQQNEYVRGTVTVSASFSNPDSIITGVNFQITKSSQLLNAAMQCSSSFTSCTYLLDTAIYSDGAYTFAVTVNNILGTTVTDSVTANIDNTPPSISVGTPSVAKGVISMSATITDENPKSSGVTLKTTAGTKSLACTLSGKTLSCTDQLNSSSLEDGLNTLTVTASDATGNSGTGSKTISVDNKPPVLKFLKVDPINLPSPKEVAFTAGLNDTGSSVKSVRATIRHASFAATLNLVKASDVWYGRGILVSFGQHDVDIEATDENDNSKTYTNSGYFFVGNLSCGDGICRPEENYCLCSTDCSRPSCGLNEITDCSSGLPACISQKRCGDKICSSDETCASCSTDCGSCSSIAAAERQIEAAKETLGPSGAQSPAGNELGKIFSFIGDTLMTQPFVVIIVVLALVIVVVIIFIAVKRKKVYESFLQPEK